MSERDTYTVTIRHPDGTTEGPFPIPDRKPTPTPKEPPLVFRRRPLYPGAPDPNIPAPWDEFPVVMKPCR